jgi:HPt (histidine-containing phosphotransfer) domain-containing protein
MNTTPPQLNRAQLDMLRPLRNGTLLPKVLAAYRDEARTQLERLHVAVDAADLAQVVAVAHSLKSASLNVGADAMGARCAAIEQAARSGTLPPHPAACAELDALYAALLPELEQELAR